MPVIQERYKSYSELSPSEWKTTTANLISELTPDEFACFLAALEDNELQCTLSSHEYEEVPVSIDQWIDDPYYMGEATKSLYGAWRSDLIELFSTSQYQQALIIGGIGSGKSEFSSIAILRMLYEASCLKNPAQSYGLAAGSKIGFCNLAPSETTARRAAFEKITDKLRQSPYFSEVFVPLRNFKEGKPFKGNEILFPKGLVIVSGSSTDTAILGTNVMGGFIDELNFFRRDAKNTSHMNGNTGRWGDSSKAGRLFDSLFRRMQSRFLKKGKLPGILIGATSKTTLDSLSERYIRDAAQRGDRTVFVRDRSIIDVKRDSFSDQTFRVIVGNEYYRSRILNTGEDIVELGKDVVVIDIPEDLRRPFETNIDEALRDLAGISTMAISTFITQVEKLNEARDFTRSHPFICPLMPDPCQWDSRLPYSINWHKLSRITDNNEWEPILNPHAKRHCHFDPALTGDAFGVAIGHVKGLRPVERMSSHGDPIVEYQPEFIIDFVLRIKGEVGEEVLMRNVRKLIYEFSEHGFHFGKITMDTFQSREMCQQLEAQGYRTGIISVDESKEPYYLLRTAIYENRFHCYDYPLLFDELRCLEDGPSKVDHPPNGCFTGETRISLLDGTRPMIADLAGKEVWVYSATTDGQIVPGRARGRMTKLVTDLVDVVLDSGAVVRCTPEHRWMLWDGTYKEAQRLRPGIDRLMPLNQHWPINGGYERVTNRSACRAITHRLVEEYFNGPIPEGWIVHHKNGLKTDNRPENLERQNPRDHAASHTTHRWASDAKYRAAVKDGSAAYNARPEVRKAQAERLRHTMLTTSRESFLDRAKKRAAYRSDIDLAYLESIRRDGEATSANAAARIAACGRNVIVRVLREAGFATWADFQAQGEPGINHKVRMIIPVKLEMPVPVFDLEVDEWHNFALSAGVFVHNSKDLADGCAGLIWSLTEDALTGAPLLPALGLSFLGGETVDGFSIEPETSPTPAVEVQQADATKPRVYQKGPKTVMPSYTRIAPDGSSTDLTKGEAGYAGRMDVIETG